MISGWWRMWLPAAGASVGSHEVIGCRWRALLPAYMVPAAVVVLDAIPLTVERASWIAGRCRRRCSQVEVFRAPTTPVEEIVAQVFAEVLGVERVGLDDDFFALGGNSLIATQVAARLGAALDTAVPVRVLFEASTVAGARCPARVACRCRCACGAECAGASGADPLSLAQQRMWFLNQFDTGVGRQQHPGRDPVVGCARSWRRLQSRVARCGRPARDRCARCTRRSTAIGYQRDPATAEMSSSTWRRCESPKTDLPARCRTFVAAGFDVTVEVPLRAKLFEVADDRIRAGVRGAPHLRPTASRWAR